MKKRLLLPSILLLVLSVPVRADAPGDQYGPFAKDDAFVYDRMTHLRWQRFGVTTAVDLKTATASCTSIGAGFRPATVKELLTLVDETPHDEFEAGGTQVHYIDRNAFPGTPTNLNYIALSDQQNGNWVVNFRDGTAAFNSGGANFYVRCVRAEP